MYVNSRLCFLCKTISFVLENANFFSFRLYNLQKTDTQTPGDHRLGGVLKKFSGNTFKFFSVAATF